jgi:hypothetical protein
VSVKTLRRDRGPSFAEVIEHLVPMTRGQIKHRIRLGVLSVTRRGGALEFDADQVERYRKFLDATEKARVAFGIAAMEVGL